MLARLVFVVAVCGGSLIPQTLFARAWRDQKGNVINADFVKVEGGKIFLKPANKFAPPTAFPFYDFCEEDQEFVKSILEKRGQADRIPPPPQKDGGGDNAGANRTTGGGNIPISIRANPTPEQTQPAGPTSSPLQAGSAAVSSVSPSSNSSSVPITVNQPTQPIQPYQPVQPNPVRTQPTHSNPQDPGHPNNTNFPFGSQMIEVKQCSTCRKEVSMTAQVGQRCPHCGVTWTAEQNEQGQVVKALPGPADGGIPRGVIRLAVVLGAFVIGGIAKLVRDSR